MSDKQTIDVYGPRVAEYAALELGGYARRGMEAFAARLPERGHIFDLGCGPGVHAEGFLARGYKVSALDATPAFVEEARSRGVEARVGTFDELAEEAVYDGVWASFSLLHDVRANFTTHVAACARALKPGGAFFLGMKLGEGEHRDSIGRFYSYYSEGELTAAVTEAGMMVVWTEQGAEPGLSGEVSPFMVLVAVKDA